MPLPPRRLGITVTRKVGNAVERNRVKRLVREVFRRHKDAFPAHGEIVVVARTGAPGLAYDVVEREVLMLCRQRFVRS